jgi:ATP-dependent DNA helicase RecG
MIDKKVSLGSETEQVEFKKSTGEIKEAVISIAAILNKHGRPEENKWCRGR